MSNQDFDPQYSGMARGANANLNLANDLDPDQAGRAIELENYTGVPATYISRDIQDFEARHKLALSQDIMRNNPYIMDYINSHPLAASVSQNDWSNLDNVTNSYKKVTDGIDRPWWTRYGNLLARGAGGGTADVVGALGRIIGSENLSAKAQQIKSAVERDFPLTDAEQTGLMAQILTGVGQMAPMIAGGLAAGAVGPEAALATIPFGLGEIGAGVAGAAAVGGLQKAEETAEAAEKAGAPTTAPFVGGLASGAALNLLPLGIVTRPWEQVAPGLINWGAAAFKRALASGTALSAVNEVGAALDAEMARWTYNPNATYSPDASRMVANMLMGMTMGVGFDAIKAYIDSDSHIPPGLHPMPDRILSETAKGMQAGLDDLIDNVNKTDTAEHGPGGEAMLSAFLRLHPDTTIHFDGDKVLQLYGDKQPEAGDNLLGWAPNIDTQLAAARNGAEVSVPFADYLAHARMNPEMDKALHDSRRIGTNGLSLDDVKNMAQAQSDDEERRQALLETPEDPRYLGGMTDTGSPVLDSILKSLGADKMFPVSPSFWFNRGKGILGRTDLGIKNAGGTVSLIYGSGVRRANKELVNVEIDGQTTGREILQGLNLDKFPTETRQMLAFFRDRANEIAGDLPIYLINEKELNKTRTTGAPAGYYEFLPSPAGNEGYIALNSDLGKNYSDEYIAHVVIHELAHAVTFNEMRADPGLRLLARQMMNEAKDWLSKNAPDRFDAAAIGTHGHGHYAGFLDSEVDYAFYNEDEFIAQARSSPEFMSAISKAPISDQLKAKLGLPKDQGTVWDGIKAFVRQAMEKIFGKLPDTIMDGVLRWSEIIHDKQTGGMKPPTPTVVEPLEPPIPTPTELFRDNNALGYTPKHWEQIKDNLIEWQKKNDEWRLKKAEEEINKNLTQQRKNAAIEMEPQARAEVYQQPVIKADLFLRYGQTPWGEKLKRQRLNGEFLTDDQKRDLHQEYWQKGRGGLNPDEVAPNFGYRSGAEMISDLIGHSADINLNNSTPTQWLSKLVKDKLDWMLDDKFGSLKEEMLKDAKDHIMSQGFLHLAHQDTIRIATKAGLQMPMSEEEFRNAARDELHQTRRGSVNSDQLIDLAGRVGRQIEQASSFGDWAEAYRLAQRRQIIFNKAIEMREFEALEEKGQKVVKGHVAREPAAFKNPDAAQFHDFIQMFMLKYGMRANGNTDDLLRVMRTRTYGSFRDFVDRAPSEFGVTVPAPDFLKDVDFTVPDKIKDRTIGEAQSIWQTLAGLDRAGKRATKYYKESQAYNLKDVLDQMYERLETFPKVDRPSTPGAMYNAMKKLRLFDASSRIVERLFNRWDGDDPRGVFNQFFSRPFTEAANHESVMDRRWGSQFRALGEPKDFKKVIKAPSVLRHNDGAELTSFTNMNKLAIMLNMGNSNNWWKFYAGRGMDDARAAQLRQWIMTNSTKEEWQWVQGVWDIFSDIKKSGIDPVYLRTVGFPPADIPISPVETPFGTFKGGYYPLIGDHVDIGPGSRTAIARMLDGDDYFQMSVPNPHAKERTTSLYPLSLTLDHMPDRFYQMIHDIAFKEAIMEAVKVMKDPGLIQRIKDHYGDEYLDAINSWLERIAKQKTFNSAAAFEGNKMSEFLRQNMMSFYVGFNISTVLKHGPTALITSARRIGVDNLIRGYANLYRTNEETGESWNDFINKNSEEIQRRSRDWAERFGGVYKDFTQSTLRDSIIEWGSKPVAFSDMLSAKPMWLGAYLKAIDAGQTRDEAIFEADREVRYAHGSTAPTNLPEIATGSGIHAWMTSLYHFFGTMLQNRMEIAFKLNDMYKMGRQGELKRAAAILPLVVADVFAYVVWPTAVEEYVTGLGREDRRGWGQRLAWATAGGLANSVIFARDIVHALEYGVNESGGLADSAIQPMQQAFKDIGQALEGKKSIYNEKFAGNLIQDLINLTGYFYGVPREIGNLAKYGWDYETGAEVPHTGIMKDWYQWGDVGRGLTHGSQKMAKVNK